MARTRKQNKTYNGFAIPLQPDTDLGNAMLIVEDEEGHYEPLTAASTINEGKELAQHDLRFRLKRLESEHDPDFCPYLYKLWARGLDGRPQEDSRSAEAGVHCHEPTDGQALGLARRKRSSRHRRS
jgi:hypothetical protein